MTKRAIFICIADETPKQNGATSLCCAAHTAAPDNYLGWHAWAARMSKTHRQQRCPHCLRWAIWERKPTKNPRVTRRVRQQLKAQVDALLAFVEKDHPMSDRLTQAQQRLQEMAAQRNASGITFYHEEEREKVCLLAAQCVALVQQVAESNPWVKHESGSHQCAFCRAYRTELELQTMDSQFLHGSDCLYQHARQLTDGER